MKGYLNLIGNPLIQKQIKIAVDASKERNSAIPHMLFSGVPGCGKTSTARALASTSGGAILQVQPEALKTYTNIIDILGELDYSGYSKRGDKISKINPTILFIDEIHRLPITGQEKLGIAMEEYRLESDREKGRYVWFPLFTVIGATTEEGLLSKPFRERFKLTFPFNAYSNEETEEIIAHHAMRLGITITNKAIRETAKRCRGIPRIAVTYLELLRDRQLANKSEIITSALVFDMFKDLGIDNAGLNEKERAILLILYESKTPIGLSNLAAMVNCSQVTLADSSEPFLLREGFIYRGTRGRSITPKGIDYVKTNCLGVDSSVKEDIEAKYVRQLL